MTRRLPLSAKVFLVCGLCLAALGLYFLFLRQALLPKDSRDIGSAFDAIFAVVPGLQRWLGYVLKVMGGFMVATGAMTMPAVCRWLAKREPSSFAALSVVGAASIGLMSAINFILHSDFRWLLLLSAFLRILGLACCLKEVNGRAIHLDLTPQVWRLRGSQQLRLGRLPAMWQQVCNLAVLVY